MSSPKEKAQDLFDKMYSAMPHQSTTNAHTYIIAKQCAIEAVDEIIKAEPTEPLNGGYYELHSDMVDEAIEYWKEVKEEIEKL